MNLCQAPRRSNLFLVLVSTLFLGLAGCSGDDGDDGRDGADGADGQDALGTGTISVSVTSGGAPIEGATISTDPATVTADTDANGEAILDPIPIGIYDVVLVMTGSNVEETEPLVGVAAGATSNVAFTVGGLPGAVTGTVFGPDGSTPVEGATVSTEGSAPVVTDANGEFVLDAVTRGFLSVEPPDGTTLLAGGTNYSVGPGADVDISLSGGPESDANFVSSDTCILCHESRDPGIVEAWQNSGHYRVVERSLIEMDTSGWPDAPGSGCSEWFDTGILANDVTEDPALTPSHNVYIRSCDGGSDPSFDALVDGNDDGPDEATDTTVPVYATYGGPGTAAGEVDVLRDRGDAEDLHGAWKQRYMFNIGDDTCPTTNPEGTFDKNAKPDFVSWDTSQTCEDMLILPIQYNQRTDAWVSYHTENWYTQGRTYSKKCSGCHEAGLTIEDVDGNVTEYAAVDYRIGCEKCHGPGSGHAGGGGDVTQIINPALLTADIAREVCGQCHSRGSEPLGVLGFPWRSDVDDFDGNFVGGIHTLDFDSVEAPEGYYLQKPGLWPSGYSVKHHQQYNDFLRSTHTENPYDILTCHDCHSPHSGYGGPDRIENADRDGNEFEFLDNEQALMSNVICLSCHATHGPFAAVAVDDVAVYHTVYGGRVKVNGDRIDPSDAEQDSATDIVEQAVKAHSGQVAGMPLAPYQPTDSNIPEHYQLGEGPVGRCASCHMTKTAKSATWFNDSDGLVIEGDASNHGFDIVPIQAGTDQPNTCGKCHASFRTSSAPPGED
jgi:hypothetical protein